MLVFCILLVKVRTLGLLLHERLVRNSNGRALVRRPCSPGLCDLPLPDLTIVRVGVQEVKEIRRQVNKKTHEL